MRKFTIVFLIFLSSQNLYSQSTTQQIFNNGLEAFYGARFDDAIKFFDDYIKSMATDWKGYNYRGLSYQALKNYPRSIEDFTRVISVTPRNSEGYVNRGNSFYFQGDFPSAFRDFSDALKYNVKDVEAYLGIGRVLTAQRKFNEALKEVNSAAGIDPTNARVYVNMALINLQLNDSSDFFRNVASALYYDSNIVFTDYRRDLLYVKIENFKNAMNAINFLIKVNPYSYIYYFARGFTYFLLNSFTKAKENFDMAVKLNRKDNDQFNSIMGIINRSIVQNSNK